MSIWIGLVILASLVLIELAARVYHYRRYGLSFQSRVFAEYPYEQFVEEADPPLGFRLKPGYRSPAVNINRQGMRGPELSASPGIKRVLVMGESQLFGVKLFNERDLWSFQLQKLLDEKADSAWEVINSSFPGYNTAQYKAFFEQELLCLNPDLLILNIGVNDITQARIFGEKWFPGITYQLEFAFALARKSPWWEKFLNRSCWYFLWRRKYGEAKRQASLKTQPVFQKDECFQSAFSNIGSIARRAQDRGSKVAFLFVNPAYEPNMSPENQGKIESLQSNWRHLVDSDGPSLFEFYARVKSELAPRLNLPVIDLRPRFWSHPHRFRLYFDLYHFKPKGMRLLAGYLHEEIQKLGWWK
ncbi:MAG: SGNH/GDSL hydrolase family protein [Deltaproteobacteria bacterium]|nr:MAG: SGNH/GDSL hydrolase family protein [Deltaproteobacteria bacterium]